MKVKKSRNSQDDLKSFLVLMPFRQRSFLALAHCWPDQGDGLLSHPNRVLFY